MKNSHHNLSVVLVAATTLLFAPAGHHALAQVTQTPQIKQWVGQNGVLAQPAPSFSAYGYPRVTTDPSYARPPIRDAEKVAKRRAYEAHMWDMLSSFRHLILDLRTLAAGLPRKRSMALRRSLELASGDRAACGIKLAELSAAPNDLWERLMPMVERAFEDLRQTVGRSQVLAADAVQLRRSGPSMPPRLLQQAALQADDTGHPTHRKER